MTDERLKVVLVDDSGAVRTLLRHALESEGFAVIGEGADASHGAAVARRTDPHAVVLDLMMPGSDGADAVSTVRAAAPHAVIVVYSAAERFAAEAVEAGAAAFVSKLDGPEAVAAALRRAVTGT